MTETDKKRGLEIHCRIAPVKPGVEPCVVPEDESLVRLVAPADYLRNGEPFTERIYRFGKVFDGTDDQRTVFEACAFDFVQDLIKGQNSLLFTYGVTGSGKTHTMAGSVKDGKDNFGILPRALYVLFKSLQNNMVEKGIFRPNGQNGFVIQSPEEAKRTRDTAPPMGHYEMRPIYIPVRPAQALSQSHCSTVFVSYVEIYNNLCYDLLDENVTDPKLRTSHDIRTNPLTKTTYVEKVKEVEVHSVEEALEQFLQAQERRQTAKTALNASSSRSHSIFTIRLVTAPWAETDEYPIRDSDQIRISEMSLVDLAGSERAKRTGNTGSRLDEAGAINSSLLVLRQCFEKLRTNAKTRNPTPVPYRDTKLTHLFKTYFEGKGCIRMIICVNPRPADFEENKHVMEFAELAREVKTNTITLPALPLEGLNSLPFGRRDVLQWTREFEEAVGDFEPLMIELFEPPPPPITVINPEDLKDQIERWREYYSRQDALRKKMGETVYDNAKAFSESLKQRLCYADLAIMRCEKLSDELNEVQQAYAHDVSRLREENKLLRDKLHAVEYRLCGYEAKDKNDREREKENRAEMRRTAAESERKSRLLNAVTTLVEAPITTTPTTNVAALRKQFDTPATAQDNERKRLRTRNHSRPPVPSKTANTGSATPSVSRGGTHMNTRYHRRSQSVGVGGRVLDHQPVNKIPTGTVFQPQLPRNSRHTTRISTEDLKKCTDYLFTNQSRDVNGSVRTDLVKGSIIPTAGGGRSVMFNDVEVLRHQDPTD
uniref:Kinesin-like protein n=1 Tax=Panagrellus redivivus TaxID=6233 RepID=A0A7E4V8R3_PANRE